MPDALTGFSRALYASWLWHRPLQLLVDAGEGLQLALGRNVFQPSYLAITHGHSDHVLGLPGLAAARRFGKGAQQKPLTIFHPEGSTGVQAMRDLLADLWRGVDFPLTWVPMAPGAGRDLPKGRRLEAFAVAHVPGEPCLGYRVVEPRRRLKAAFAALPQAEIEALGRQGRRDELMETVPHVVFVHSGDAMPLAPDLVRDADLLVHDATFLDADDRREPIHAATAEVLALAAGAGVGGLVLQHLSVRYPRDTALATLAAQRAASGYAGPVWLLDDATFVPVP
ncbi:MAG: MBL fold metallo-hydrolase [Vicinamibacterales bacterium]